MRAHVIVIMPPGGELRSSVTQAVEDLLVEELIPKATVEALDKRVLRRLRELRSRSPRTGRLAGLYVMPSDAAIALPAEHHLARQFRAVVADNGFWSAIEADHGIELTAGTLARDRRVGDQRQAFSAVVVDHGEDAEPPSFDEDIGQEVERPAFAGTGRDRHGFTGAVERIRSTPLATTAPFHRETFFLVQPSTFFMVHRDTLAFEHHADPAMTSRQCSVRTNLWRRRTRGVFRPSTHQLLTILCTDHIAAAFQQYGRRDNAHPRCYV